MQYNELALRSYCPKYIHTMNTGLDIFSHPRSMRLLAGTNEYAEDLTGQRAPMNASQWRSETQVCTYLCKGSFTNYVYKKRGVGSQKMSTFIR